MPRKRSDFRQQKTAEAGAEARRQPGAPTMSQLPASIENFIRQQRMAPVADVWKAAPDEQFSPYGTYWCRAVGCMLLSGRIRPKADRSPNMTDIERLCKEANFNQYLLRRIAELLIGADVISVRPSGEYGQGPNFTAFWRHSPRAVCQAVRSAVLGIAGHRTGLQPWRPTVIQYAGLIEFLALFFACFRGMALPESKVGKVLGGFSRLPEEDLARAAKVLGIKVNRNRLSEWHHWLDNAGQTALISALYVAECAYRVEEGRQTWFLPSPMGLGVLGLAEVPPSRPLPTDLRVLSNHDVLAGAGLEMDRLACLFRYCRIKRIAPVFELQLEPRRLTHAPATESAGKRLLAVFKGLGPLPATVSVLLGTKSKMGGVIGIRWCSALVKPQKPETLSAIREHPKLKGYLEPGAPPGYLLIKGSSNPSNFLRRCQELGFDVRSL
jgi:hypothetical protein